MDQPFDIDELGPNLEFSFGVIQLLVTAFTTGEAEGMDRDSIGTTFVELEDRMRQIMTMLNSENCIVLQDLWNNAHPKPGEFPKRTDWNIIQCADLVPEIKAKVKTVASAMFDKSVSEDAALNVECEDFSGYSTILGEVYEGLSKMNKLLP